MLVSLNWLREYVDFDLTPEELSGRLDMTGTAVESVTKRSSGFEGVVVGSVLRVEPHPHADKLSLCEVDVGHGNVHRIVCGAPNVRPKMKAPVALVGTRLPGGAVIERTRIRGIDSEGMLCSEAELALGEDAAGILELPVDLGVGEDLGVALGLEDVVLELEITPNRPDCLGMIGVAREVAAITGGRLRRPKVRPVEGARTAAEVTSVEILDPEVCPRYVARILNRARIVHSPLWLRIRLRRAGQRPINNVVDVTNYVMLETGQPLHAFDHGKLVGGRIVVRRARAGERLVTIDGVERELDSETLVIADGRVPVAIAGVMGGFASEVSERTTAILLESASFKPESIMRTSRRLGLLTEASNRFEKGVDPNGARYAAERAAEMIRQLGGGELLKGSVDAYPRPVGPLSLELRPGRVNLILGTELSRARVAALLKSIEITTEAGRRGAGQPLLLRVPSFRPDIEREIDLVEEVARLHGYENIPSTLPESSGKRGGRSRAQRIELLIRNALLAAGLSEAITYGFVEPGALSGLGLTAGDPRLRTVGLVNPLSEEQGIMRTTLLPGLLKVLRHNVNRKEHDVAIFEIGRIFISGDTGLPQEKVTLGLAMTGRRGPDEWYEKARALDFFDLKGVVETILDVLNVGTWELRRAKDPVFHPERAAHLWVGASAGAAGEIGVLGELKLELREMYGIPNPVVLAELDMAGLIGAADLTRSFREIAKYPAITLDTALVVDDAVEHARILDLMRAEGGALLESARLFDLYKGSGVPAGKKSLAYSLTFRASDRTLTDEQAKEQQEQIIARLRSELGADIRT